MASVPETMTAIEISTPGGPEVLKPKTMPTPKPAAGQILVKVAAAGVNRPDLMQRAGSLSAAAWPLAPTRPRNRRARWRPWARA